jgi:hypothetical protein
MTKMKTFLTVAATALALGAGSLAVSGTAEAKGFKHGGFHGHKWHGHGHKWHGHRWHKRFWYGGYYPYYAYGGFDCRYIKKFTRFGPKLIKVCDY